MKRVLICICAMMTVVIAMAEDVTPAEALKQATQFVQNRIASGQHSRRAAGTQAQLTQTGKVSGLYVFNVDNNGGFVVVSNDDRTEPVIGYSDSGAFDPDNMPENMRAWLQGYADEIAWLKEHPDAAVSTSRRTGDSNIKTPIAPLVKTTWNQDEPYNNQCPEVKVGENSATGCVATAMAQVMYYNKWPIGPISQEIPAYSNVSIPLTENLPIITFDWANMLESYPYGSGYTTEQANAVAVLMHYCGASVKMNYGWSSSAVTSEAANALKTYFGYNETTVSKNRSHYTYANWIELLYHELQEGRVVLYSGNSTGGGHAFICDGYQGEDYFHINWGWGGNSDSYFKLSVMNPYNQGIGGSSSTDGYYFLQGAIVGIQKPEETGTVLNLDETPDLSFNSVSLSRTTITFGESVDVTFNVKNLSRDCVFDGDIYVYVVGKGVKVGKNFIINPGETKDCVITYTPTDLNGTITICPASPGYKGGNYYYYDDIDHLTTLTIEGSDTGNTTDDIDLYVELKSIENSNTDMTEVYDNHFYAIFTITNPSQDKNYEGYFYVHLYGGGYENSYGESINIPAGGSSDWDINFSNITKNTPYYFTVNQEINGNDTEEKQVGPTFTAYPGITTYGSDGSKTVVKASASFEVPSNALAVELKGSNISSLTKNNQPNCLYIFNQNDNIPTGLTNVIKYGGDKYTAETITLTDGNGFYSPVDFTAENIEFNYNFTVGADGTNGWNTLMLPFNVNKVTATDPTTKETKEIDWFYYDGDKGKNFWVKEFTSDANNTVNFDFADEIKANTPYIVAFPGSKWGAKWDMSNKAIKFIGKNATINKSSNASIITGSNYRFIGNTIQDNTQNIFKMNDDGNQFVAGNGSAPFRAYFKPGIYDSSVTSLAIGSEPKGTTGIEDVNLNVNKNENGNFFNLNGQRVTHPTKGLYISNGKKIIIK